jgi:RNA polymerase sigma-54 factor
MKLELTQKLQQQQILAPQMILSMDILLLPTLDLEQRIQKEFSENPALELVDTGPETATSAPAGDELPAAANRVSLESAEAFAKLEGFRSRRFDLYDGSPRRRWNGEADAKHEALQNTEGKPPGLKETLIRQLHLQSLGKRVERIAEAIVHSLDHRGYLLCEPEEIRESLEEKPSAEEFAAALAAVRSLDPAGVGATDLRDCLLLQLERDRQEYPLEVAIIRDHLQDLGLNRIPKIAKELGKTIDEIKEAVEIISSLDPFPGSRLEPERTIYIRPDVIVRELDGKLEVEVESSSLPRLEISDSCRAALKESKGNREVRDFLRRKIESAQWLIQAVEQRERTIYDIAFAMVEHQRDFMLKGPEHLKAMKMQTIADLVGVHISTISRAIKGKYIQTPHGLYEMRYFFTGGVDNAEGEIESRRNVYRLIRELIDGEDKSRPYSDTDLARILRERGLHIARRTVTKYREQEGIPSSRLRKAY